MLNSISWSQFFIAIGIITTAYYVITVLLLFSHEIKSRLKGRKSESASGSKAKHRESNLLGKTHPEPKRVPREEYVSSDSLNITRSEAPDDPIQSPRHDDELLTGSVADLLEEIKTRFTSVTDWKQDEVLGLMRELLGKYSQLKGTVYQESINYFISTKFGDHFNWSIEPEEIDKLW